MPDRFRSCTPDRPGRDVSHLPRAGSGHPTHPATAPTRRDASRDPIGSEQRIAQGAWHECDGIPPERPAGGTGSRDHGARAAHLHRSHPGFAAGNPTSPAGAPDGRAVELPGLRPAPDRRASRPGLVDGRRRRQPVHGLRHGLRRPVRRPRAPARAGCDRGAARRRHPVRHAVRGQRRRGRAPPGPVRAAPVAVHQLGHRGDHGCHPRRSRGDRPGEDRQGRGRLPRPPRRGDDLDEAAAVRGRSGGRSARDPSDRGDHASGARRHDRRPVQPRRRARARAGGRTTSPRSSSNR